ncbi:MAG TPA: glucosamine-6-phosphate deaminase [Clostridia bacterium]|mgnify:FL=1|nr:glucosamine-6-phosphate deaminase [Clostridia bacterium]
MNLIITKDYEELSAKAYEIVKKILLEKPDATLGLATGSTPVGLYKLMAADCKKGEVSYKNVKSYNLDEYVGLGVGDEQSYVEFMRKNLFNHIDIDLKNTHLPDGMDADMQKACDRYNEMLANAEIDVQILGIGGNGHIAFNEPGTSFDSVTHIVNLTEKTIEDNARFFDSIDEVPTKAITMGIANIMAAKSIIILASGANKADAVFAAVKGKIDESCPASILRTHKNATFIADIEAASKL